MEDIKKFLTNQGYKPECIEEIMYAATRNINIKPLLNPAYNDRQLYELRLCLEADLDVTPVASTDCSWQYIRKWREEQLAARKVLEGLKEEEGVLKSATMFGQE